MPRNKAQEVKVGIFVAAGLTIFGLFVVALTGIAVVGGEDEYRVLFADVAGLENGSIVALGGLKVGRVERVGIAPDDSSMMEAVIRVKKGTPLRQNSKIEVTSVGITGSMFLSVSLGTSDSPLLKPGAKIRGQGAASFQEVVNEAREAASRVNKILGGLGDAADSIAADAKGLMRDVRGQAGKVLATMDRVLLRAESILSERNERNVNRFLEAVARISDTLEKNVGPAVQEFNLTLRRTRESLGEVDRTANAYTALASEASSFVGELKGRLAAADRILARMESLGAGLEKVVASGDEAVGKLREALEAEIRALRQDLKKELEATGETLRREIASVGGQARSTLQEGGQSLAAALAAIEGVSRRVEEFFEANRQELRSIIVNFGSVSKRVDDILVEISGGSDGGRLRGAAEELRVALHRARVFMTQLDEVVASHREDIQVMITDLRDTATNLNEFTTTLRERPATAIFKPPARPREFEE